MKKQMRGAGLLTLLGMVLTTEAVGAATYCAQFITSAGDDAPNYGWLIGERTETTTKSYTWAYTNFGGTFNAQSSTTQSYSVGTYQMADGSKQQLRCDGYIPV